MPMLLKTEQTSHQFSSGWALIEGISYWFNFFYQKKLIQGVSQ